MPTQSEMGGRRLNQVRVAQDSRAMARTTPVGMIEKLDRELTAEQAQRRDIEAKLSRYNRTAFHEAQMEIRTRLGAHPRWRDECFRLWHKKRSEMQRERDKLQADLLSCEKRSRAIKDRLAVSRGDEHQTVKKRLQQHDATMIGLLTEIRDLLRQQVPRGGR